MRFDKISNHSLFASEVNGHPRVFRKHSMAFSVDILTGRDAIFSFGDECVPLSVEEAKEITGMSRV